MLLRELVNDGTIRMRWSHEVLEHRAPSAGSLISGDRVRGMLLGLAIGDALGNTSEGMLPPNRQARYGEIRDYLPNFLGDERSVGLPSDDTQLAFWTLEHLLERGHIDPNELARLFCSHRIFGIGMATRSFVTDWHRTKDWKKATQSSAGNGALMRIASTVIPHLKDGSPDMWVDAVLGTAVTHNDPAAVGASVAFVGMLAELLTMEAAPAPEWWVEAYVRRARHIEGDDTRYAPVGGPLVGKWSGPLWQFVEHHVPSAIGLPTTEAAEIWYSGAYLLETVPSVLHVLAQNATDPEEAIVRAVNDTKDNDTVAAIVGAAIGALHGASALPQRWLDNLSGRMIVDVDDRKVFDLTERAVLGLAR